MVTRISLDEAQSLPDILSAENYRFQMGSIPGWGDSTPLEIKCQSVAVPGRSNTPIEVALGSFIRSFSGLNRWNTTVAATYVETIDMDTLQTLRTWLEQIRGTRSGTSIGDIRDYSINPVLTVFDQAGRVADTIYFYNFWIDTISDFTMEGANSTAIQVQATFKYDYLVFNGVDVR